MTYKQNSLALIKIASQLDESNASLLQLMRDKQDEARSLIQDKITAAQSRLDKANLKSLLTGQSTLNQAADVVDNQIRGDAANSFLDSHYDRTKRILEGTQPGSLDRAIAITANNIYGQEAAEHYVNNPAVQDLRLRAIDSESANMDAMAGLGRNAVRGGTGILADALLNDHNGNYGALDTITSAAGGIGGGLLGSYLAKKFNFGDIGSAVSNIGGSGLGGWGANALRRTITD